LPIKLYIRNEGRRTDGVLSKEILQFTKNNLYNFFENLYYAKPVDIISKMSKQTPTKTVFYISSKTWKIF